MPSGEGVSVLVTGGCGGLGGVLSLHLAKTGWTVFPTSRDGASAEAFREQAGVLPLHPVVWRWEREEDVRDGFGELERAMAPLAPQAPWVSASPLPTNTLSCARRP